MWDSFLQGYDSRLEGWVKKVILQGVSIFTLLCMVVCPLAATQQPNEESRIATRDKLWKLLQSHGPGMNVVFHQNDAEPFFFSGILTQGLTNAESFEIVIGVTTADTISFRIYPHYKGTYINVDKARESLALMRQLLRFSERAFLFWGADSSGDVFAGYTFTLESGFPDEAVRVVLSSIKNLDRYIGEMRLAIDGSTATVPSASR
jgi:hypothetical protein